MVEESVKNALIRCLVQPADCGDFVTEAMTEAFRDAADRTGPEAAIGFTTRFNVQLFTSGQVEGMLEDFQSYTKDGIVVLPANLFADAVANQSGPVLVVHPILRKDPMRGDWPMDRKGYHDMEYHDDEGYCQEYQCATMPNAIDLVVPTTNGNNSIAVPAVLGTIPLMKNANPSLTNGQIMAILTDPANFSATVTVGVRTVPVLNALEAVNAARPVLNPSFEDPVISPPWRRVDAMPGWQGPVDIHREPDLPAKDGFQVVDLNQNSVGYIRQRIKTVPAQSYTVRWAQGTNYHCTGLLGSASVSLDIDGASVGSFSSHAIADKKKASFTASGATVELQFSSLTAGCGGATIDDVSVTPN
jgi:hypothetical protein